MNQAVPWRLDHDLCLCPACSDRSNPVKIEVDAAYHVLDHCDIHRERQDAVARVLADQPTQTACVLQHLC
jgi:hypothetical protein